MPNYIPNETKRFVPRDPPWITKPLKTLLNRKNRLLKYYKKPRYKNEDRVRLDAFRVECQNAVGAAKLSYLTNMGNKVNDSGTSQRSYWTIINRVMNKCRAPKIPPILINNQFILNCSEKAKHFNNFFSEQCKLTINRSVLPDPTLLTDRKIDHITIDNDEIISLIRNLDPDPDLDPDKATGSEGISGQMLLLCDDSVILLNSIFFYRLC